MTATLRRLTSQYAALAAVVAAAAIGLATPEPGRVLARHDAINIVLAVLVFLASLTIPTHVASRLSQHGLRLLVATVLTSVTVAGTAWAVSHLVPTGPLRVGVVAAGVAPVEIATLGLAPLAGGEALASAVMLMTSTLLTALFAGPAMAFLAGGAQVQTGDVAWTLLVVVVVPLAVGLAIRSHVAPGARARALSMVTLAVVVLVWLVASQARLSADYLAVGLALVLLIIAGAGVGLALGRLLDPPAGVSLVFAASMRDFAIASGIATAAVGAAAAAPLGLYGIMVMTWGAGGASVLRHHRLSPRPS